MINVPHGIMEPTQATKNALNAFKQQGNLIFIATARGSVPFKNEGLEFDGFMALLVMMVIIFFIIMKLF